MGRIDIRDALAAAERFRVATALQAQTEPVESRARGIDRHRDFTLASRRVFLERVIEDSDLLPVRYLA